MEEVEVTIRGPFDFDDASDLLALRVLASAAKFETAMRELVAVLNRASPALTALHQLLTDAPPAELQRWEDDGGGGPWKR